MAILAETRKKAPVRADLTPEIIKQIISCASEREEGLQIQVVPSGKPANGKQIQGTIRIRGVSVAYTTVKEDGRVGFHVEGSSYITVDVINGNRFMKWLKEANKQSIKNGDYGNPDAVFRRCN